MIFQAACRPLPGTLAVAPSLSLACIAWLSLTLGLAAGETAFCQVGRDAAAIDAEASSAAVARLAQCLENPDGVSELPENCIAVPLTRADAASAANSLWQEKCRQLRALRQQSFDDKRLRRGDLEMQFEYREFGDVPASGSSLFISMHGGGEMSADVNDRQWRNQIRLYQPSEGIYVAPRAPTNSWNMWHQPHIDEFFSELIEDFVLFKNVNPNRVFLMGYSAGGDGVYQLAPRMADRFAAAAMMAGHPNEAEPWGLRNLAFTIHMGAMDAAFNRNEVARQWGERLDQLRAKDPDGYVHWVKLHEGKGHWMDRDDAEALAWMTEHQRNPLPRRVVWKQDDVTHDRFYWLGVPAGTARAGAFVSATIEGQTVAIESDDVETVTIRLNDDLIDLDQELTVRFNAVEVFRGMVPRTISTIRKCLEERADPASIFSAEVQARKQ